MKILLAYYSRTGTTKRIAEEIKESIDCDIEELISVRNRSGMIGFLFSGKEGSQGVPADIKPIANNPADYDLVIIGTPIWSGNLSSPARRYLLDNAGKFKKISLFCTMGGNEYEKTFNEMEKICGLKSIANLAINGKEIAKSEYRSKLGEYISKIA